MYTIPTEGANLEIMGYPFYCESVSPNEAFRRREYNFNNIVGGTMKVTPGAYVALDFNITTHVFINPDRPDEHNKIFQEMMSKPVEVVSPEIGGSFNAVVVIKPERDRLNSLKLTISVKEIPEVESKIPGESWTVPATKQVDPEEEKKKEEEEKGKGKGKNSTKSTGKSKTTTTTTTTGKLKQFKGAPSTKVTAKGSNTKTKKNTKKNKGKTDTDKKKNTNKNKRK